MSNITVLDPADNDLELTSSEVIHPISMQVSLTGLLLLEMVLGLSSNLMVLVLYCLKQNLVSSISSTITINLHVLDVLVCMCCPPLTIAVVLLPAGTDSPVMSCFHEACISFASVAASTNVLAITVDRYVMLTRPARRGLTARGAAAMLATVWALSLCSFLLPFAEVGFFSGLDTANRTTNQYHTDPGLYCHLLAQTPIFFFTAVIMLATYYKILQALHVGRRLNRRAPRNKTKRKSAVSLGSAHSETTAARVDVTVPAGVTPLGMRASVSAIIALRRAVKRHRERRERQKRVLRMSLLIICTFIMCWTPITLVNTVILSIGPGRTLLRLRPAFLVAAYASTIFHPLLYAFSRNKLQTALRSHRWRPRPRPTTLFATIPGSTGTLPGRHGGTLRIDTCGGVKLTTPTLDC